MAHQVLMPCINQPTKFNLHKKVRNHLWPFDGIIAILNSQGACEVVVEIEL
jgi:hypothetical protein